MTPEQEGLLQKAYRNIRSAKLLVGDGDFDTAVSRAYYAMFYVAEALLLSKGLAYSKHSAVIAAFGREFVGAGLMSPEFHANLRAASEARNISDHCCPANDLRPADKPFFLRELHGNLACRDLNGNWS